MQLNRKTAVVLVSAILLLALGLRLTGLNWGEGSSLPSERAILNATQTLQLATPTASPEMSGFTYTAEWIRANIASDSKLRPAGMDQSPLPAILLKVSQTLVNKLLANPDDPTTVIGPMQLARLARPISALAGVWTIWILYLIGARWFGRWVGVLAALFLSMSVLHIQVGHCYTADSLLTLFGIASIFFYLRLAEKATTLDYLGAAFFTACAVATRSSALALLFLFCFAFFLSLTTDNRFKSARSYLGIALFCLVLLAVLFVLHPFAFLNESAVPKGEEIGFGPLISDLKIRFALTGSDEFWTAIRDQRETNAGRIPNPQFLQYKCTLPYFYSMVNLCRWFLGWPLGLVVCLGLFYFMGRTLYDWHRPCFILAGWTSGFLLIVGRLTVKNVWYLTPILPFLCLFGAIMLCDLMSLLRASSRKTSVPEAVQDFLAIRNLSPRVRTLLGILSLFVTLITIAFSTYYSMRFVEIYKQPHTWFQSSKWIYENAPAKSKIVCDQMDEEIPKSIAEQSSSIYVFLKNPVYDEPDTRPDKIRVIVENLVQGDFLVLAGTKGYGGLLRLQEQFPVMSNYYRALFAGSLGYELVKTFTNSPTLFGAPIDDSLADDSFTSFDHPKVCVFKKVKKLPKERLASTILSPPEEASCLTLHEILSANEGERLWIREVKRPTLKWFLLVELLGIFVFPIVFYLCRGLPDRGMALSKCFGVLLFAFIVWILVSAKLFTFSRTFVLLIFFIFGWASFHLYRKYWSDIGTFLRANWKTIFAMEAFYVFGFLLFAAIRMHNPDVYWGEKPMNTSFLAAVDRAATFPPMDPWISGKPINYYYYGQLIMGILGKTIGTPAHYTFNLACVLIPALTMLVAFGVVYNLTRRKLPGFIAGAFITLIGNYQSFLRIVYNIANLPELAKNSEEIQKHFMLPTGTRLAEIATNPGFFTSIWYYLSGLWVSVKYALWILLGQAWTRANGEVQIPLVGFDYYFWKCGHEIIPATAANEFPLWSFLFADLHAHIIVMPFFLMFITLCLNLLLSVGKAKISVTSGGALSSEAEPVEFREPVSRSGYYASVYSFLFPWRFLCYGLSFGVVACVNAWDMPSSLAILAMTLVILFMNYRPISSASSLLKSIRILKLRTISRPWMRRLLIILHRFFNQMVLPFGLIVGVGVLLFLPFHLHFHPAIEMSLKSVHLLTSGMTSPLAFLKIFLLFLFIIVSYLILRLCQTRRRSLWSFLPWLILLSLPHIIVLMNVLFDRAGFLSWKPFSIVSQYYLAASLAPFICLALHLALRKAVSREASFGILLALVGFGIACGLEIWYIREFMGPRFNTIFKLYLEIWNLWALAAAYCLYRMIDPSWMWFLLPARIMRRILRVAWVGVLAFLLLASSLFLVFGPYSVIATNGHCNRANKVTMNGLEFKRELNPAEYRSILWMNRFIEGAPVFAESHAEHIYSDYSRISMYTGLPLIIGWDNHIKERGFGTEIEPRQTDLKQIYREQDPKKLANLLDKWGVEYIYFGELEKNYGLSSLERLKSFGQYLDLVYQDRDKDGDVHIFRKRPTWSADQMQTMGQGIGVAVVQETGVNMFHSNRGNENGNFNQPRGLNVDSKGNVYVADTFNHRVQKFNAKGDFVKTWGEEGAMEQQFKEPNDALVIDDNVFILDTWNQRIQKFDAEGKYLTEWDPSRSAQFFGPRSIASDAYGKIYVADTGNGRVEIIDKTGRIIRVIGGRGKGDAQFDEPTGVAVSLEGKIYVADSRNSRVQVFSPVGDYERQFPLRTPRQGEQSDECHVAISKSGRVFVTDSVGGFVAEYDLEGNFVAQYNSDFEGRALGNVVGICVLSDDEALVTSLQSNSVRKISIKR